MAILTNSNVSDVAIRIEIIDHFNGLSTNLRVSIMKGTMPGELDTFDPSLYTSDLLAQFDDAAGNFTLQDNVVNDMIVRANSGPINQPNATATGTATWWVMHHVSVAGPALMGDVTDEVGDGTVKLDTVSLISGNPVIMQDFAVRFTEVTS